MKWVAYKDKPIPEEFDGTYFGMRYYVLQVKIPDDPPEPRYPGDYEIELVIGAYTYEGGWMWGKSNNENQIVNYAEISDVPTEPYEELTEFRKRTYK